MSANAIKARVEDMGFVATINAGKVRLSTTVGENQKSLPAADWCDGRPFVNPGLTEMEYSHGGSWRWLDRETIEFCEC